MERPLVRHPQEGQEAGEPAHAADRVAEDDGRLVFVLPEEVVCIEVLLFFLAADSALHQGVWHALLAAAFLSVLSREINDLRRA